MIALAQHTGQILNTDRTPILDPLEITLETDETWSPRWRARVTIHSDDLGAFPDRVIVRLRAAFGSDLSVAAITEWAGGSVSGMTARAGGSIATVTGHLTRPWNPFESILPLSYFTSLYGGTVSAVTAAHGGTVSALTMQSRQPGGAYLPPPAQAIEVQMRVRSIRANTRAAVHEIELASEEIALHDYRRMSSTTYVSTQTTLRDLMSYVLDLVGGTWGSNFEGSTTTITPGAEWDPGQTAWDFLHPIAEKEGLTIWAQGAGTYRLAAPAVTTSTIELAADTNLIDWETETTPTEDAAIVKYDRNDPAQYDIYAPIGAQRPRFETRTVNYPGTGAAEQIALRAATRAKNGRATATNRYDIRPFQNITIRAGATPQTGTVSSVEWNYPAATMSVRLRDIT